MSNKVTVGPDDTDIRNPRNIDVEEKTIEEIKGWVIDELNKIEQEIDQLITDYYKPAKAEEFKSVVLNTSIVSTGSKLKILRNVPTFNINIISKLQTIIATRNAFAHAHFTKSVTITLKPVGASLSPSLVDISTELKVMNSGGEIKTKKARELIKVTI